MNGSSLETPVRGVTTLSSEKFPDAWDHWLGVEFLETVGLHHGDRVLDFGAGPGHYSLPAALTVGRRGAVYALDTNHARLRIIRDKARHRGIRTITPLLVDGEPPAPLREASLDVVLAFDVMHLVTDRTQWYREFWRLLHPNGCLTVYPKHCKDDMPLGGLADCTIAQVRAEVERCDFRLRSFHRKHLCHDESQVQGVVLSFHKGE